MGLFDSIPHCGPAPRPTSPPAMATGGPRHRYRRPIAISRGGDTPSRHDPEVKISGVVLNQLGSGSIYDWWPKRSRHWAFRSSARSPRPDACAPGGISAWSGQRAWRPRSAARTPRHMAERHLDLDAIRRLATPPRHPRPRPLPSWRRQDRASRSPRTKPSASSIRMSSCGIRPAPRLSHSPLLPTRSRPHGDCCWLPGGYPELHAGRLASRQFPLRAGALRCNKPVRRVRLHGAPRAWRTLAASSIAWPDARPCHQLAKPKPSRLSPGATARWRARESGRRVAGHEFHYAALIEQGATRSWSNSLTARAKRWGRQAGGAAMSAARSFTLSPGASSPGPTLGLLQMSPCRCDRRAQRGAPARPPRRLTLRQAAC